MIYSSLLSLKQKMWKLQTKPNFYQRTNKPNRSLTPLFRSVIHLQDESYFLIKINLTFIFGNILFVFALQILLFQFFVFFETLFWISSVSLNSGWKNYIRFVCPSRQEEGENAEQFERKRSLKTNRWFSSFCVKRKHITKNLRKIVQINEIRNF